MVLGGEINFGSLPTNPSDLHYPGNAANFHFVNVVNSLSWPRGGELSDELARVTSNASEDAGRLCVTLFNLPNLPANITNQYDAGDNGNCVNVIDATCAQVCYGVHRRGQRAANKHSCRSKSLSARAHF